MSYEKAVEEHYLHGRLLDTIQESINKLGKIGNSVTIEDLAPVDEFHIGGRTATRNFLDQFDYSDKEHILDVGCGLGGASRYIADKYNIRVTGIDLTQEYIITGNALSRWVNLDTKINLQHGSALSMPFQANTFDGAYMMHVGMNIENKLKLFKEIYRVLRPGSFLGVYDVMQIQEGTLNYPVPWASKSDTSKLASPEQYTKFLHESGFEVSKVNNRRDFALNFFNELRAKIDNGGSPPPLGLHILMKENTPLKIKNMIDNIDADYIAPVEIFAYKNGKI
ncbi:MAG: methyltransferase domain-containing protein [Melioribacteraceae bacterium]|nr:MAG: methyltransferase domain-containing protein [Melioribacteraceae bacterium]